MKLSDLLLNESATVKEAIERLETIRCKVVYIVKGRKLMASVSDGDIRRFSLKAGNINESVYAVANKQPYTCNEYEKEKWQNRFQSSELYSLPIVNLNKEVIGVVFRNGTIIKDQEKVDAALVMMAGGKGTRLHPYTKILPKALIPIGDIPISEHILNRFHENGCNQFYLLINHKGGMIKSYFNNIERSYSLQYVEEKEPLGTGGGLSLLKGKLSQDFILTNCDILIDADFATILKIHKKKSNFITMILAEYNSKIPYGVVSIDEENNYEGVTEKPTYKYLINTGVYIVNPRVVEEIPDNTVMNFPDIIERYKEAGEKIGCYIVNESAYMDMGQFEELERMKEKLNV